MTKKLEEKVCSKCLKAKKKNEYYMSSSDYLYADRKLGICKSCIWKLVDFDNKQSLIKMLREINKPFLQDMYLSAKNSNRENKTGEYMRLIGMRQNRDLDFQDSNFGEDENEQIKRVENVVTSEKTDDELKELIKTWGNGYSKEEYLYLQNEYETLLNSYESDSYVTQMLFQEAAQQRLTIKQNREKGQTVDKDLKTLQDLLGSANIKPTQETGANATEQQTFGTLIKKFEDEHPIPEPNPEWDDVDGIKKYIDVFFKGHLMRMLGKKNDKQKDYDEEIDKYTVYPPTYEVDDHE